MILYHVHTKINIPSLNNEDQCPRQQHHHDTVITLLIKMVAAIVAKQHGQIQCKIDWYFWGKTGNCHSTCCLLSSVNM
jgi:hypothetical protein